MRNGQTLTMWKRYGARLLPFADVASEQLPLSRLLRLSLFQIGAGMTFVLLNGTLNRVMIVELAVPATLVALMIALPLIIAPIRALIGHQSDNYVSYLGWRRVPYLFLGSLVQFGGLAILPFALILLSGDTHWPVWFAQASAALAFLLVGIGMHTVQTAGLALATDVAPEKDRTKVVALLFVMLLVGMVLSAVIFSLILASFSQIRLIQMLQGTAVLVLLLNLAATWKQESRNTLLTRHDRERLSFAQVWSTYASDRFNRRFLLALAVGTAAFSMQDVLLEPYGAHVLDLDVAATTLLTGVLIAGSLCGFALAARSMANGADPYRLAAYGVTIGLFAFFAVMFSAPLQSNTVFRAGTFLIGGSAGVFSVSMLAAEMQRRRASMQTGLALGVWGAVQTTAAGIAIAFGGIARDLIARLAEHGQLGVTLANNQTGYMAVYLVEIVLLLITLVVLGPLVGRNLRAHGNRSLNMSVFPG